MCGGRDYRSRRQNMYRIKLFTSLTNIYDGDVNERRALEG